MHDPTDMHERQIRAAVIGAGTMGAGIAQVFARHGHAVYLVDVRPSILEHAKARIRRSLERQARKGVLGTDDPGVVLDRIVLASDAEAAVSSVDIVVEAVVEDLVVKRRVFEALGGAAPRGAVLASNTSSIPIAELAAATAHPERVIGLHFFNPVPVMRLVEVVCGRATSGETLDRVLAWARALGKEPVRVRDAPGFVSNRVLMPMINEACFCVMEGVATAEDVDRVMTLGMRHPMGPLALADLIGLDVCLSILEVLYGGFGNDKYRPCPLLEEMVAAGRLGCKSGRGFYEYP